jgi:hypothetical protein
VEDRVVLSVIPPDRGEQLYELFEYPKADAKSENLFWSEKPDERDDPPAN